MRPDIPFWTWVLARRIPVFALITTVIMALGSTMIARYTPSYMSTAEMLINPTPERNRSVDRQTHFEFLKFRVLTSGEIENAISEIKLQGDPLARIYVNHDRESGKIIVGFQDSNPESALMMTIAITQIFLSTAQRLERHEAQRRADFHASEARSFHDDLARSHSLPKGGKLEAERRLTEELYQTALANLAKAKANVQMPSSSALTILRQPSLAKLPSGPNTGSMYLALLAFSVFCGVVVILILEWIDTVIRRPHDIEATLGLATFGVIPDLQLQPIEITPHAKRGL